MEKRERRNEGGREERGGIIKKEKPREGSERGNSR
jgi:hypothetical protein